MKTEQGKHWNYLGSLIGFVGALLMAFAMATTKEAGSVNGCSGNGNVIMIENCDVSPYVIMKHPYFNLIGIILISIGFFIQFLPVIIRFFT
ncbi:MAG: hypothetical protein PHS73_02030, partial [Candidatus Peribacteraceae bacterium]|nr:hypothetical protein [Candidatus Peribacteraceae bacterium]